MQSVVDGSVVAGLGSGNVSRLSSLRTRLGQTLLTGLVAGLIIGAGFRIAMRLAAIVDPRAVEFTVGGSLFVATVGIVAGIPMALLYVGVFRRFRGGRWVLGVASAALVAVGLVGDPAGEASVVGERWMNAVTFPIWFLVASLAMGPIFRYAGRRVRLASRLAAGALAGFALGPAAAWTAGVFILATGRATGNVPSEMGERLGALVGIGVSAGLMGALIGMLVATVAVLPRRRTAVLIAVAAAGGALFWTVAAVQAGPTGLLSLGRDRWVTTIGAAFAALVMGAYAGLAQRLSR